MAKKAIVEVILAKHNAATNGRKFNAVLAAASINDAIEYHALFKTLQAKKQAESADFQTLLRRCWLSDKNFYTTILGAVGCRVVGN